MPRTWLLVSKSSKKWKSPSTVLMTPPLPESSKKPSSFQVTLRWARMMLLRVSLVILLWVQPWKHCWSSATTCTSEIEQAFAVRSPCHSCASLSAVFSTRLTSVRSLTHSQLSHRCTQPLNVSLWTKTSSFHLPTASTPRLSTIIYLVLLMIGKWLTNPLQTPLSTTKASLITDWSMQLNPTDMAPTKCTQLTLLPKFTNSRLSSTWHLRW